MQTQGIANHGAAVVVEHDNQPRLGRLTPLVEYPEVERGVVDLPHLVGSACLATVQQLKPVGIGLGSIMCASDTRAAGMAWMMQYTVA